MKKRRWRTRLIIVLVTVSAFVGTVISVLRFHRLLLEDEYELQKEMLLNMAKLEASVMEVKLEDYINTLISIVELMDQNQLYTQENMDHLSDLVKHGSFQRLGIVTLDGILHSTEGDVDISDRDYYQRMLRGETFVTGIVTSKITGNRIIVIAVPAYDSEGTLKGAVHGAVLLDEFRPYEGTSLGAGNSNSYILDSNGHYIIKNNIEGASWNYDNIFEHLEQAKEGIAMADLRSAMEAGQTVTTEMVSGGIVYFGWFVPIRNGQWYALVATPIDNIDDRVAQVLDHDFYGMLASVLCFVGILCVFILILGHRQGKWEKAREVELRERLLSKVVGFMVADLDEERILSRSGQGMLRDDMHIESYPEYIKYVIEKGCHPDYKKSLFQFFSAERIRNDLRKGLQNWTMEFLFCYTSDGENVWLECESHVDKDKGTGHLIVSHILRDISSRKKEELVLREEAERDALTGLYNRNTGTRKIEQELASLHDGQRHAFVLVDLDYFKTLNDTLGHQCGDQALKDVAGILVSHFRKEDIVCRLGGDEFVIFMRNISADMAREKLTGLLEKLHLSYEEKGQVVRINASAGIVFVPGGGSSFEKLYHHADSALYQAKHQGKGIFREYRSDLI